MGGSVVTLMHLYRILIGNYGWGAELSHNLNVSCGSDYLRDSMAFSKSFKNDRLKWQFAK